MRNGFDVGQAIISAAGRHFLTYMANNKVLSYCVWQSLVSTP